MTKTLNTANKVLDVVEVLAGFAAQGVTHTALCKGLEAEPAFISRTMKTLVDKGWARKCEDSSLFYPTPRMGQVFGRVLASFDEAERNLTNLKSSFTAR